MNDGLSPRRERPFRFTFASDVLADPPFKFWHVRGIIASRELSVVYGAPGDGKSVIVGDIACHASSGLDWFGHEVSHAVGVLYIAAERADLVKRRIAAFMLASEVKDMPFVVLEASPDLTNEDDLNRVLDTAYRAMDDEKASGPAWEDFDGFSWIIVDTKARTMGGADENAAKDMNRFVAGLARLQSRLCAHVTVIDHTPHHDKSRMRGHSALLGAADVTYRISRTGNVRLFEVDKVNDGPDDISHAFDLRSVVVRTDEDGEEQTALIVVPVDSCPFEKAKPPARLNDRQTIALRALSEVVLRSGLDAPASFALPMPTKTADLNDWREEMVRCDVIKPEDKNPRATFSRLRDQLVRQGAIGIRDGRVWLVAAR